MRREDILTILEKSRAGEITLDEAVGQLTGKEPLGEATVFARVDHDRRRRCGFPEFVYGAGKTPGQVLAIVSSLAAAGSPVLVTRFAETAYAEIREKLDGFEYDPVARTLLCRKGLGAPRGRVLIVSAGTSDLPTAMEAKNTAEMCGLSVDALFDAGVAGIHRLLSEESQLRMAEVIIAVAGMEGALPSVVAGLVACPVIAVPTSAGYGASFGGVTALLAMLNSCATGVTVTNIDNGFGAACAAARILNSRRRTKN